MVGVVVENAWAGGTVHVRASFLWLNCLPNLMNLGSGSGKSFLRLQTASLLLDNYWMKRLVLIYHICWVLVASNWVAKSSSGPPAASTEVNSTFVFCHFHNWMSFVSHHVKHKTQRHQSRREGKLSWTCHLRIKTIGVIWTDSMQILKARCEEQGMLLNP